MPQGSILGPLLFIIFINDLSDFLTCGKFVNFADDANVLIWANSFPKLERNLILCNIEMKVWCKLNKLLLNETKTSIVQFRSNFRTEVLSLSRFQNLFSKNTKFLGMNIDEHLKWQAHLQELKVKLSKAIFGIRKIREISDEKTALMTYYALFHSVLSYGIMTWGNCPNLLEILRIQKKAIRAICYLPNSHSCKSLFRNLNVLTLPSIYIFETLKYVKKTLLISH